MVEVAAFLNRAQAELAAGMLRGNGIHAEVRGDDAGQHLNLAMSGAYSVVVDEDDHDAAVDLFDEVPTEHGSSAHALPRRTGVQQTVLRLLLLGLLAVTVVGMLATIA